MNKPQQHLKNRISGSHLFLMELILALLLFSVAAAACVSVFVKAHGMSKQAADLTEADADLSSVAELLRGSRSYADIEAALAGAYPDAHLEDSGASGSVLTVGFEKGGGSVPPGSADYTVTAVWSVENAVLHADLTCTSAAGAEIASLSIDHVLTETDTETETDAETDKDIDAEGGRA